MISQKRPGAHGLTSFSFVTLGCKSNQYDSAALAADLRGCGLHDAGPSQADIIVVNTCMVTAPAQAQCRKAIRQASRANPHAKLIVTGCMTRGAKEELARLKEVDLILDPDRKGDLPRLLGLAQGDSRSGWLDWPEDPAVIFRSRDRAFLKIQEGCDRACSYCIVPSVRGGARSLDPVRVRDSVRKMMEHGFREVVLTGIHLGQYGQGLPSGNTLETLLCDLVEADLPGRIRLSSLDPGEITDGLLDIIRMADGAVCRHLHIAIQSGSGRILRLMNRPYDGKEIRDTVGRIRESLPGVGLGCDLICGFPGETPEDFALSEEILETLSLPFVHAFPFSPRPGTPASLERDSIPSREKKDRVARLRSLASRNRRAFAREQVGSILRVAVESAADPSGCGSGLADNYLRVKIEGAERAAPGNLISIRIDGTEGDTLKGHSEKKGRVYGDCPRAAASLEASS